MLARAEDSLARATAADVIGRVRGEHLYCARASLLCSFTDTLNCKYHKIKSSFLFIIFYLWEFSRIKSSSKHACQTISVDHTSRLYCIDFISLFNLLQVWPSNPNSKLSVNFGNTDICTLRVLFSCDHQFRARLH